MARGLHCNRPHPGRGETIVSLATLDDLRMRARAHDDYLVAIRTARWRTLDTGAPATMGPDELRGYRQCLIDMATAIVKAQADRMEADGP